MNSPNDRMIAAIRARKAAHTDTRTEVRTLPEYAAVYVYFDGAHIAALYGRHAEHTPGIAIRPSPATNGVYSRLRAIVAAFGRPGSRLYREKGQTRLLKVFEDGSSYDQIIAPTPFSVWCNLKMNDSLLAEWEKNL